MSDAPTYYTATDRRTKTSAIEEAIIAEVLARGVPVVPGVKLGQNWVFHGAVNGTRLLIEIHGDYWHQRPEVRARDARKQTWASLNGYTICTVWEREYQTDPEGQLQRILAAYAAARPPEPAGGAKSDKSDAPRAHRRDYGDWRDAFLAALRDVGVIGVAAEAAGITRETVNQHRHDDPAFDAAVKDARRDAADKLRAEYYKRAMQQSDRAMEYMIRHLDPDEAQAGAVGLLLPYLDLARLTDEQLDRLAAGENPLQVILGGLR